MRKLLFLSSIGMVISVSLLLWCCDRSDSSEDIPQTEADRFVASAEYQRFSREIDDFSGRIYRSLSAMSSEDRAKVIEICTEAQKTENLDQVMSLAQDLKILTGIDYIGHTNKINELSMKVFESQKFTSDEFVKAIHKQRFLDKAILQTRSSEPTTSVTVSDSIAALINACIQGCKKACETDEYFCNTKQGTHDPKKGHDSQTCAIMRSMTETICVEDCIKRYSQTTTTETTTNPTEPPTEPTEPEKPVAPTNPSTT